MLYLKSSASSLIRFVAFFSAILLIAAESGRADPLVFEAGTRGSIAIYTGGQFRGRLTGGATEIQNCGEIGSIPVPGRYLATNGAYAVWNPSSGFWRVCGGLNVTSRQWGLPGDLPAPGDFNGDLLTDYVVFRRSTGEWFQQLNTGGVASGTETITQFGLPGDLPVPEDYDGDGLDDQAVFRYIPSTAGATWFQNLSGGGVVATNFGLLGDIPVPADYEAAGEAQIAVWRPRNGTWFILGTGGGTTEIQFGLPGDIPAPADLTGDTKYELVVFRPSSNTWFYREVAANSPTQSVVFGTGGGQVANDSRSAVVERRGKLDFNGDRLTDLAMVKAGSAGQLEYLFSTGTSVAHTAPRNTFGANGDTIVSGDYDGDSITDLAVAAVTGNFLEWRILRSAFQSGTRNEIRVTYGLNGDQVMPADYDGDRKTDLAVVRNLSNANKLWIPTPSGVSQLFPVAWGFGSDRALTADFDGDGRSDYCVVRLSGGQLFWFIRTITGQILPTKAFGLTGDLPFVGEFTGDEIADIGVIRVTGGVRYVFIENVAPFIWGLPSDISLFANYSGLRADTAAVWRLVAGQGYFLIRQPVYGQPVQPFGVTGQVPLIGVPQRIG